MHCAGEFPMLALDHREEVVGVAVDLSKGARVGSQILRLAPRSEVIIPQQSNDLRHVTFAGAANREPRAMQEDSRGCHSSSLSHVIDLQR